MFINLHFLGYIVGLIGLNITMDGLYSLILYLTARSYRGKKQTWQRDHWVRCVRMVCGIALIIIGGLLVLI